MPSPTLLDQLFARDPRHLVRFPELPIDEALAEWPALLTAATAPAPPPPRTPATSAPPPSAPAATPPSASQIATLATQLWRARVKLLDPQTTPPGGDAHRSLRHIESSLETLAAMGVCIRDHLQEPYDPGLPINVITFLPTAELARDTVIETIRPSIFWHDRLLQSGEVIVGTPPATSTPNPTP
ncbi:MAG: hypothetical protein HZA31_09955 [Opitutae bacterium]|nr:hypothetical protein [Opitutae bacterium]